MRHGHVAARALRVAAPASLDATDSRTRWLGEKATVSGGTRISGWRDEGNGVWSADVPAVREGKWYFEQLFVNSRRAIRARWPKAQTDWRPGTNRTDLLVAENAKQTLFTNAAKQVCCENRIFAKPGDVDVLTKVPKDELKYASLMVMHQWEFTRRAILGYDTATHSIVTYGLPQTPWCPWNKGSFYYVENVRSAFTDPGEWFLDARGGKVYYRPLKGEKIATSFIEAPRNGMAQLLLMNACCDVQFDNITFACSDSPRRQSDMNSPATFAALGTTLEQPGPTQYKGAQASANCEAAVMADGISNCIFTNCCFTHTGEYGLWIRRECSSNRVERCLFDDTGAGGIRLGIPCSERFSRFNTIRNCRILRGGRFHPSAIGIWVGDAQDSLITHNHIKDYYYSGISIGWSWSIDGHAFRNVISWNLIEDIGQRMLFDFGGIYTLGLQTGTRIEHNVMRNMDAAAQGGRGLYMDQGSSGITATCNLVEHTFDSLFCFHYGRDNVVSNNIFAFAEHFHAADIGVVMPYRVFDFVNNIVYWDSDASRGFNIYGYRDLGQPRRPDALFFDRNIWWCTKGAPVFGDNSRKEVMTFREWQTIGHDLHSVIEDPHFKNPRAGDYRFTSEKTIRKTGFEPFDNSAAGVESPCD